MFASDYPRGAVNCLWLCWFPAFDELPVAAALTLPFLPARRRRPVFLLGFPSRPFPRLLPAALAAIALTSPPGMKALLTPFEQTGAGPGGAPRPAGACLPPTRRLLRRAGRILDRAHGR